MLSSLKKSDRRKKIILLRATPKAGPRILELGLREVRFRGLFRHG